MLQPNKDRLDYGNLLIPPEGFQLENAIATSYSLDLDALISVPVALYFAHSLDVNLKEDVVQVLDSVRRASDTLKVFCQKGQIKVPDNQHRLYSFIEPCIVEIPPTHKSSFHPKIWIIRYKNKSGEINYRVIVLSRNLTFDRSWDVAFQIDGKCVPNQKFDKTKPLIDFINYLAQYENISWLKKFVLDLGKTQFELSNEFKSFEFHPMGINGYRKNLLFDNNNWDELLIISPFLSSDALMKVKNSSKTKPRLFSREYELQKVKQDVLAYFDVYHLGSNFVEGEEKLEVDTEENNQIQLQDLHAKIYSYKNGWNADLFLGSANCSRRAMFDNIEFMIQLTGKNSTIGPDVIFKELINDELTIFQKYDPTEEHLNEEQQLLKEERILQHTKIEIINTKLSAKAIKQDDLNYTIEFNFDFTKISPAVEIEAAAYMLNAKEQKHELKFVGKNFWSIRNIAETDISCFLIVELKIRNSEVSPTSFTIKTPIDNLPETRGTKIFRDIISNTANFFKYIRFLLAENYWEEDLAFSNNEKFFNKSGLGYSFSDEEPLYENMLKAVSRNPEKLDEIKKVMERLKNEGEKEKRSIIPEDFEALWNMFEEIRRKKK